MAVFERKYWVCGCASNLGEHINAGHYSACIFCGKRRFDCEQILVPSGLGGVFSVEILDVLEEGCQVQNAGNCEDFDEALPYFVPFEKIRPQWRTA